MECRKTIEEFDLEQEQTVAATVEWVRLAGSDEPLVVNNAATTCISQVPCALSFRKVARAHRGGAAFSAAAEGPEPMAPHAAPRPAALGLRMRPRRST